MAGWGSPKQAISTEEASSSADALPRVPPRPYFLSAVHTLPRYYTPLRYAALLLACSCGSSQQQARRPQTAVMSARRRAVGGKKMQLFNDTLPPQRMVFVVVYVLAGFSTVESDSGPEDDLYSDEQIDRCILSLSCCCSRSRSLVPFLSSPRLPLPPSSLSPAHARSILMLALVMVV